MKASICFLVACMLVVRGLAQNLAQANMPVMVAVEGGTFTMGNEHSTEGGNGQPLHSVSLKSYKIAATETTVAQWRAFCQATQRPMPDEPQWGWIDSHPVVNVSWSDAVAYTKWLSKTTKVNYRLPTEAEWEYAARGGKLSKGTKYSGSNEIDAVAWYESANPSGTHAVATKSPNELGLYDMSGNVMEWCKDWYEDDYYKSSPKQNPKGPSSGEYRALRGGSWVSEASICSVGHRTLSPPEPGLFSIGFRVVQAP